ncbi:MAG: hypothetical protein ACUZ8H_15980 [Candidatus Anammoxibacter sp.]
MEDKKTQSDMAARNEATVRVKDVMSIIDKHFDDARAQFKNRSPQEQEIIGSFLVTTELELKKDIKNLPKVVDSI